MAKENKETLDGKTPDTSKKEVTKKEGKLLTQEQFDIALTERLTRAEVKMKAEAEKEIEKAKIEAEKLAKLSQEEREKELKAKSEEDSRLKDESLSKRENRLDVRELFVKAKIPTDLIEYVIEIDKETTLKNADIFIKNYSESVAKSVAEQLKGDPPKDISVNSKGGTKKKKVVTTF